MNKKRWTVNLGVVCRILPFFLLLVGCSPGSSAYEGPLEKKTSIILKEGKGYVVCFELKKSHVLMIIPSYSGGLGGISSRNYPILNKVVSIHDEMGNTISNTIMLSSIRSYAWCSSGYGRAGISVAKFSLEGKGSRSIAINVNMAAYRDFAIKYNKRGGMEYDETFAPSNPNVINIREVKKLSLRSWLAAQKLLLGSWFASVILLIAFLAVFNRHNNKEEQ